ncbi:MAG: hypothetical protein KZQ66_09940 [Candidatus Thiodiazotropha sp. (ex Lucinoma aequizonata)]|nr:hypothetical protein [Candidatus Thiodiazotropha sp. (ex Lucinoma aequizonata)]MCU7887475.1 hypothetical protein [Candidatus Thiodiazotropha sp. (ex Lucinoma aequizonata)]MCU7896127.1 hypothetical protein [Candidatus Thiodiazotropha sp. (ex Lucinoma aequizonata)]MCU7899763.1 hypothetical protein [Candidatus Thiodiazotropha sp. (ex Lucinoma aequizonata)]MCU7902268.1 hypothetical protein [Candidatus Thiodiazotropha sp. (ex Lucinoma aequizonata)]
MPEIPDITDSEHWIIEATLTERYEQKVETQIADAEIRLMPSDRKLTSCPVIYWNQEDCNFIIFKSGSRKYRCQFFYRGYQQYGTGVHEYDDLTECIVSLLQAQADHEARKKGGI